MEDRLVGKTILDTYRIVKRVGAGGMGTLYEAIHVPLDQVVALKFIHPHVRTPKTIRRFRREAQTLGALKHANIVGVKAFYAEGDEVFFVMEFLAGEDLASYIERKGPLSLPEFKEIFSQVVDGVEYLHSCGIIHRDLKPANIMLIAQPDGTHAVKILDFGLAKVMDQNASQRLTASGAFVGTLQYVSPEQLTGKAVDERSDVYSLACVMFEALSGQAPFGADASAAAMSKHFNETLPQLPAPELAAISTVLQRCTSSNPQERLGTVTDMWNAIVKNESIPNVIPVKKRRGKKSLPLVGAGLGAAVLIVGGFILAPIIIEKAKLASEQSAHAAEVREICRKARGGELVPMLVARDLERTKAFANFSAEELREISDACAEGAQKTTDRGPRYALTDNMIESALQARQAYREMDNTDAADEEMSILMNRLQTEEQREIADMRIRSRLVNAHFGERFYDKIALLLTEGELMLALGNDYIGNDRLEESWGNSLKILHRRENPPTIWNLPPRRNVAHLSCKSAAALMRRYCDLKRYNDAVKVGEAAKTALAPWSEATPADLAELNNLYASALQKSKQTK